jgi:hypothetical protein
LWNDARPAHGLHQSGHYGDAGDPKVGELGSSATGCCLVRVGRSCTRRACARCRRTGRASPTSPHRHTRNSHATAMQHPCTAGRAPDRGEVQEEGAQGGQAQQVAGAVPGAGAGVCVCVCVEEQVCVSGVSVCVGVSVCGCVRWVSVCVCQWCRKLATRDAGLGCTIRHTTGTVWRMSYGSYGAHTGLIRWEIPLRSYGVCRMDRVAYDATLAFCALPNSIVCPSVARPREARRRLLEEC